MGTRTPPRERMNAALDRASHAMLDAEKAAHELKLRGLGADFLNWRQGIMKALDISEANLEEERRSSTADESLAVIAAGLGKHLCSVDSLGVQVETTDPREAYGKSDAVEALKGSNVDGQA